MRNFVIRRLLIVFIAGLLLPALGHGHGEEPTRTREMMDLGLDELVNVQVTTASRKAQPLSESAAAVHVITAEDIRRSGMTSLPELLRMVPGVEVARITAHDWAIAIRGFNGQFSNKLLVLIDGRSVYTPLFAGVYWDLQELPLDAIDRIEVIRGPGAALWGSNAVNGVINVITKEASETHGTFVTGGGGDQTHGLVSAMRGGDLGDNGHYRAYARFLERDDFVDAEGRDSHDGGRFLRGGIRIDSRPSDRDTVTIDVDLFGGRYETTQFETLPNPPFERRQESNIDVLGGHALGRWRREWTESSSSSLQIVYDGFDRDSPFFREVRDTFDVDFQHRFAPVDRHDVVWGLGYRYTKEDNEDSFTVSFRPLSRGLTLVSGFLQDEVVVIPGRLHLIAGTKLEHNDFTGLEIQPNGRVIGVPVPGHTVWASVSRAARTPSRSDRGLLVRAAAFPNPGGSTTFVTVEGTSTVDAEHVTAFDTGYRVPVRDRVNFDLAAFYNDYDDVVAATTEEPSFEPLPPPGRLTIPIRLRNIVEGQTWGVEASTTWVLARWWRLVAAYSWIDFDLRSKVPGDAGEEIAGDSPENRFHLRSLLDLPSGIELDTLVFYVDRLETEDVDSYVRLDTRIGWTPRPGVELSLTLQNALDPHHPEFTGTSLASSEVQRSLFGRFRLRF